jgi:hypothetical protein
VAGKIDQWIYFDSSKDGEIVLKEERDINGDGMADLWAYHEDGRLVRRDVNAVGAELLSKHLLPFRRPVPETFRRLSRLETTKDEAQSRNFRTHAGDRDVKRGDNETGNCRCCGFFRGDWRSRL